ncbi:hypothetical protein COOONC_03940 [Cooperia oncophora]
MDVKDPYDIIYISLNPCEVFVLFFRLIRDFHHQEEILRDFVFPKNTAPPHLAIGYLAALVGLVMLDETKRFPRNLMQTHSPRRNHEAKQRLRTHRVSDDEVDDTMDSRGAENISDSEVRLNPVRLSDSSSADVCIFISVSLITDGRSPSLHYRQSQYPNVASASDSDGEMKKKNRSKECYEGFGASVPSPSPSPPPPPPPPDDANSRRRLTDKERRKRELMEQLRAVEEELKKRTAATSALADK